MNLQDDLHQKNNILYLIIFTLQSCQGDNTDKA